MATTTTLPTPEDGSSPHLLTVFTPPGDCLKQWTTLSIEGTTRPADVDPTLHQNMFFETLATPVTCLPDLYSSARGTYSPGVCPAGYATVSSTLNVYTYTDGEVNTVTEGLCCPSGYKFAGIATPTYLRLSSKYTSLTNTHCWTTFTRPVVATTLRIAGPELLAGDRDFLDAYEVLPNPRPVDRGTLVAKGVWVLFRDSDAQYYPATTTGPSSDTPYSTGGPPGKIAPADGDDAGGENKLATPAVAGLVVAGLVVAGLALWIGWIFLKRYRRRRLGEKVTDRSSKSYSGAGRKAGLSGGKPVTEEEVVGGMELDGVMIGTGGKPGGVAGYSELGSETEFGRPARGWASDYYAGAGAGVKTEQNVMYELGSSPPRR